MLQVFNIVIKVHEEDQTTIKATNDQSSEITIHQIQERIRIHETTNIVKSTRSTSKSCLFTMYMNQCLMPF
jgi:SHS2 domain-containing protein